jgi:hypothetical protein
LIGQYHDSAGAEVVVDRIETRLGERREHVSTVDNPATLSLRSLNVGHTVVGSAGGIRFPVTNRMLSVISTRAVAGHQMEVRK